MIFINTKITKIVVAASVLTAAVAVPASIFAFSAKNVNNDKASSIVEVESISGENETEVEVEVKSNSSVDNAIADVLNIDTTEATELETTTTETTVSTKATETTTSDKVETTVEEINNDEENRSNNISGASANVPLAKTEENNTEKTVETKPAETKPVETQPVTQAVVETTTTTVEPTEATIIETEPVTEAPVIESDPVEVPELKSVDEIAAEVLAGKWGNGDDRKNALEAAGYNYDEVQAKVQELKAELAPVVEDFPVDTSNLTWVKNFSRGTYYCYGCAKKGGSGRALIEGNTTNDIKGSIASSYLYRNYGYNYNGSRTTVYLEISGYPEMNGYYYLDDCDAGNPNVIDFYYVYSSNCPFRNQGVVSVDCWIVG